MPPAVHATRIGANAATRRLQILPDSTLRGLAASSAGLGAGLYLGGVPRFVAAAGVVPALIMSAAIILRPGDRVVPTENR